MTTTGITATTPVATDDGDSLRRRLRSAGSVLLLGGVLFLAGVSRPAVTEWANAWDDPAAQLQFAQAAPGEFTLGFVLMGLGYAVMGTGAGRLLLAMGSLSTGRRAQIARIIGWVGIVGGMAVGGHRAVLSLIDYEAMAVSRSWVSAVGTMGLGLGFTVAGLMTWRGPIWRWPSLAFALLGVLGTITIPAVFMFAALAYGLLVIFQFRPRESPRLQRPS